jgi:hypothetical protein
VIEQGDNDIDMIDLATNKINETQKFATASVYGLKRKAIYREGLGATLLVMILIKQALRNPSKRKQIIL